PVADYPLQCDETFACPSSLRPRVSFWVEVFSRWDTSTAIFHDKDNPHRVYSTIKRKQGCRRSRNGDSIDRERKRLTKTLQTIASRVAARKPLTESQLQIEKLFIGEPVSEIRAAAHRIRCQSGNQDRMEQALKQFQLFRPTILDALESQNLSPELQYLPFVESAFNPEALSHLGAAGLWQIMPATGRRLGLTVNHVVDERYDPTRATYAAAKYFRDSVDDLSDTAFENGHSVTPKNLNPFVVTSYNYGVRGMQNAIRQVGLNYERLLVEYKSPNFQTAVKNFYASFLAARYVAKNVEDFFPGLQANQQDRIYSYNTVKLDRATSIKRLSKELQVDKDLLKRLNPALKRVVWQDKALVPKNYKLQLPYRESGWQQDLAGLYQLPAERERPGYLWHRVKSGQTACGIAESYRASCRAVFKLNRLNKRGTIYAGQRIKIPTKNGGISVASGTQTNPSGVASGGVGSTQAYRIKRGDTACIIANSHNMRCAEFLALNGLKRSSVLQIGQKVVVASAGAWHTVSRGQTPCGIADRYRVPCSALLTANRLRRSSTIYVGQRLRIPRNG
ncbi:MAG: LysM peptidoglycan-binding domain-containing protein, partial [Gammaproteobacteria bacterium]|nr:LysM peptidoglycan-binding domain-containing protein [Gammaproteobacteria bacterium]